MSSTSSIARSSVTRAGKSGIVHQDVDAPASAAAARLLHHELPKRIRPHRTPVKLRMVSVDAWQDPTILVPLEGGQGTINVPSWAHDGSAFAYVDYSVDQHNDLDDPWAAGASP
jgi:hypothetical protein